MDAFTHSTRALFVNFTMFSHNKANLTSVLLVILLAAVAMPHTKGFGYSAGGGSRTADSGKSLGNPLLYFLERSPGARDSDKLLQTKHAIFQLSGTAVPPFEGTLAEVRYAPLLPAWTIPDFGNAVVANANRGILQTAPTDVPPIFCDKQYRVNAGVSVGSLVNDARYCRTPPAEPRPPHTVPTSTPTATVPELSTWSMLISGIFLIGASLRSRRRLAEGGTRGSCRQ